MNIGWIGLGKLGLPCALAVESKGHTVYGYDVSESVVDAIDRKRIDYREEGAQELLDKSRIKLCSMRDIVESCDIIFCAVQTPHDPRYEGVTPAPAETADFNYDYLEHACERLVSTCLSANRHPVLVVISTVLPGTMRTRIKPIIADVLPLVYNPFFIAMGTAIADFLYPEFVLLGCDNDEAATRIEWFYESITEAQVKRMSVASAELTKVAYNTLVSAKIGISNTLMEICHKTPGANVDEVTGALKLATKRVVGTAYMNGGMGDGGGCHPRDLIAMSHLAKRLTLSFDPFTEFSRGRDAQTKWLADLVRKERGDMPVVVLGRSFKPETNIETGSPARLLAHYLGEQGVSFAQFDRDVPPFTGQACFFVATKHDCYRNLRFPAGSVVLDPFRYIPAQEGVRLVPIGVG